MHKNDYRILILAILPGTESDMTFCKLRDTCCFYNIGSEEMTRTTEFIKYKYCLGDFSKCPWYLNCQGLWEELVDEM
jgi:hypothetical protein